MQNFVWGVLSFFVLPLFSFPLIANPSITDVSPCCGPAQGSNLVTITGKGLNGATSVHFGNLAATEFTVISDTSITAIAPISTPGTVDIVISIGDESSSVNFLDRYTFKGNWFAYVSTQNDEIIPINLETNELCNPIPIKGAPYNIAITPDGKKAYIATERGFVFPVNLDTNEVSEPINLPQFSTSIAITTDGKTAFVVSSSTNQVIPIDLTTNTPGEPIPVGNLPIGIALTPDDSFVYVTNAESCDVTPIDLTGVAPTPLKPIRVGNFPVQIAITPNGEKGYVVNAISGSVTPIDILTNKPLESIQGWNFPVDIAISPDGARAYVVDLVASNITPINTLNDTTTPPINIDMDYSPTSIAITPDGQKAYISLIPEFVLTMDLVSEDFIEMMPLDGSPRNITISPDQAPAASFTISNQQTSGKLLKAGSFTNLQFAAGMPIVFDATDSPSPVGTVQKYLWSFGDGTSISTLFPIITHTYQKGGNYLVTLQVINSANTSIFQIYSGRSIQNNGSYIATRSLVVEVTETPPSPVPDPTPAPGLIFPPSYVRGKQVVNRFINQSDRINVITWKRPKNGITPTSYQIYRDKYLSHLLASISADKNLKFEEHNRKKERNYTYYLISIDAAGSRSAPAIITIGG